MEKALIVGVNLNQGDNFELSMKELASLAEACNMEVVGQAEQNMENINTATYIGSGKVEEVKAAAELLEAEIIIFERSGYISYANCGLPYYVGGVIKNKSNLALQTPESFFRRFKIIAKVNHEVTNIDTQSKTVFVTDLKTGIKFEEKYDKLKDVSLN